MLTTMTMASTSSGWNSARMSLLDRFNIASDSGLQAHFDIELRGLGLLLPQARRAAGQRRRRRQIQRHLGDLGFGDILVLGEVAHEAVDICERTPEIAWLCGQFHSENCGLGQRARTRSAGSGLWRGSP